MFEVALHIGPELILVGTGMAVFLFIGLGALISDKIKARREAEYYGTAAPAE